MKKSLILALSILLVSCGKKEYRELFYEYDPNQPVTITANVVAVEHSLVSFEDMELEVNADYFHRYGIHIDLTLKEQRESLEDDVKFKGKVFFPKRRDTLTIYVVPHSYVNISSAVGYALPDNLAIVISERVVRSRTLAHEIGHIYGLEHTDLDNNVMTPFQGADWTGPPNYFEDWQIGNILTYLNKGNLTGRSKLILD